MEKQLLAQSGFVLPQDLPHINLNRLQENVKSTHKMTLQNNS
jgi:hypothetical protein